MRKVFGISLAIILVALIPVPFSVQAQGTGLLFVHTAAEVTGTATAVQIATSGNARWIQVIAPSTNSAVLRCGDSNVSATRGLPIAAGGGFMFPQIGPDERLGTMQAVYNLANVYCFVGSGDKADFAWGY